LPWPVAAFQIERRELRGFHRRHALRGIAGQHIGRAGDESGKGQRGVQPDRALAQGAQFCRAHAQRIARLRQRSLAARALAIAETQALRRAAIRRDRNADIADIRTGDLPRQRETVGKAVRHPVRAELGRQEQVQRAGVGMEHAQLDRPDPLGEQLLAQVLAQALADV